MSAKTIAADVAPAARVNKQLEKDLDSRRRSHMNEESTHIRVGTWRETAGDTIELVGHARDLHGTVCTCCARKVAAA